MGLHRPDRPSTSRRRFCTAREVTVYGRHSALAGQVLMPRSVRPDFSDTSDSRRRNMAAIRGKNTGPELLIRQLLHRHGYRYRLHAKGLPGRPDIVFQSRRKVIEIRGCFWHRHAGCSLAATPATRVDFWKEKFDATVIRDACNAEALEKAGWSALVIWECEIHDPDLFSRLQSFLGEPRT